MNLDPRTVVILTVLSTLLMGISLYTVARGYLSQMRGVTRWASGTLLQSAGWILLALIGILPAYLAELGSPLIMFGLALYHDALLGFKGRPGRVRWVYVVVCLNVLAIYYFLLVRPDMSARIVVASGTGAVLMLFSARVLLSERLKQLPISHILTGLLFAICSGVLTLRAFYYLIWNTAPDQSAFDHNFIQDIAFLTFFLAGVLSSFTFILMCNDRYNDQSRQRTLELAKKNEELEEASRAKGQFLATMSHEIRTPLNGVIGFINQLGKTNLDEQQRDYLNTLNHSARLLMSVINDILDYSKIDAGKLAIEAIPVNLRAYLEDTVSMFAANAEEKGLALVCIIDRRIQGVVLSDPVRLTQIISNLIGNAIKFTDRGEIRLEVSLLQETKDSFQVEFSVVDTGIGIDADSLARLFQPFIQADASTTRKYGGTGLGLVIVRKLVEMMGGNLNVESTAGKGTHFHISLNLQKGKSEPVPAPLHDKPVQHAWVVTASRNAARGILENLAVMGIAGQWLASGNSLIETIQSAAASRQWPSLVLVDQYLPDMALVDCISVLGTSSRPEGTKWIVLCNSSADCINTAEAGIPEFDGFLHKPVKQVELKELVNRLFNRHADLPVRHAVAEKPAYAHPLPLQGTRILIVDDNPVNLKLMQILVAQLGGAFDAASNGEQAVRSAMARKYDLILMDINMPVMDGPEAAQRIRNSENKNLQTPIVALTANALPGDREKFLAAGMDDYLAKPVGEKALIVTAGKWLSQVRQEYEPAEADRRMHDYGVDLAIFDPVLGLKLSFDDKETWHVVLNLLLDELPDYDRKFDVIAGDDLEQLAFLSHKLAGSSCYCGTPALTQAARDVENFCLQRNLEKLIPALADLKYRVKQIIQLDLAGKLRIKQADAVRG